MPRNPNDDPEEEVVNPTNRSSILRLGRITTNEPAGGYPYPPLATASSASSASASRKFRFQGEAAFRKYPWLEYSRQANNMQCFICRCFTPRAPFKSSNYKNWKDSCNSHNKSQCHQDNEFKFNAWTRLKDGQGDLEASFSIQATNDALHDQKNREENSEGLAVLMDSIRFLGRQSLAYRGHDESLTSQNRGNFMELLKFLKGYNPKFKSWHDARDQNAIYTSAKVQNEMIRTFGERIQANLAAKIEHAGFFSIMRRQMRPEKSRYYYASVT